MGLPDGNPDGYKKGSPVTFAKELKGNLFIVHGTGDDNVHYQGFELLVNELVTNNKAFTQTLTSNSPYLHPTFIFCSPRALISGCRSSFNSAGLFPISMATR